jgi:hypothetical protein
MMVGVEILIHGINPFAEVLQGYILCVVGVSLCVAGSAFVSHSYLVQAISLEIASAGTFVYGSMIYGLFFPRGAFNYALGFAAAALFCGGVASYVIYLRDR